LQGGQLANPRGSSARNLENHVFLAVSFNSAYFAHQIFLTSNNMFISICIPVYKNLNFLKRLLDSINLQTFKDFEVIVSDDSEEDNIQLFCEAFKADFTFRYSRNPHSLGSPENWNEATRQAKGEWIKLMHDDDWFADKTSLEEFVRAIRNEPSAGVLFSAYNNYYFEQNRFKPFRISPWWFKKLVKNPNVLLSRNVIGAPSVVIYKKALQLEFDNNFKWLVDIDFYIRAIARTRPVYINKILINVGIGKEQITQDCFRQRPVEIPESFYLLNKTGISQLRNILVYDAWWRLLRNLEIKDENDISRAGYHEKIPAVIKKMIRFQKSIAAPVLRFGPSSKALMAVCYLIDYKNIIKQPRRLLP
jgi:glycosyltransferase involved in cell wall biosynthesis